MFKKKKKLHIHLITNDRSIFDTSSTIACLLFSLTHILFRRTYLIAFMETPRWMEGRKGGREGRVAKRTDYVSRWSVV